MNVFVVGGGTWGTAFSALLRANLKNALRVWSAVGGSMNWALHFPYIAAYVGVRVTPRDMAAISDATPFLIDISPLRDKSFFTLAVEKAAGQHSGNLHTFDRDV